MKAVIIGGGLGGLATALRLQAKGWRVTVCEAGPTLGGKMNWLRSGGYGFDTGPSLITMPDVFADIFRAAGEDMRDHVQLIRLDPHAEYRFPDGARILCPSGTAAWRDVIRAIEPRDVAGFDKLHALGRKLYELSRRTFFARSPYSPPRVSDIAALRYLPLSHAWGNYASAVSHFFRSPALQQIYNRYPTYVGSSPWLCPATLLIIPYLEREFGAWYVKGGLYRIVEAMASLLLRRGADLRCNTRVVAIDRNHSSACGVELADGSHLMADAVVMNGDAANIDGLLGDAAKVASSPTDLSLSALVILGGVRKRPPALRHHTVLFSSDYRAEFDDLFLRRRFPSDPTIYISAPGATDDSLARSGGDALFIMANAPSNADDWRACDIHAATQKVLSRVRGEMPCLEFNTPLEVFDPGRISRSYLARGGAIYGTNSHGWRRAFYRPPNRSRRLRNVYFAGGSTHPGGGTPTVLMSARIVAAMVESDARS